VSDDESDGEKLPNRDRVIVEAAKLTEYILNRDHPVGGDKAAYFYRFGFRLSDWQILQTALFKHAVDARVVATRLNTLRNALHTIEGQLETPDGRNPLVRTVWSIGLEDRRPRFLTAYPGRRGGETK